MKSQQVTTAAGFVPFGGPAESGHRGTPIRVEEAAPPPAAPVEVAFGVLVGFDPRGVPLVARPADRPGDLWGARSLVALSRADLGREVALAYEGGNPDKPVVMGLVQPPRPGRCGPPEPSAEGATSPVEVRVDGERLVLTAGKEIVLRCGEASITLTSAGKVLIRGAYLSSRATGVHRIKGGSVQIN